MRGRDACLYMWLCAVIDGFQRFKGACSGGERWKTSFQRRGRLSLTTKATFHQYFPLAAYRASSSALLPANLVSIEYFFTASSDPKNLVTSSTSFSTATTSFMQSGEASWSDRVSLPRHCKFIRMLRRYDWILEPRLSTSSTALYNHQYMISIISVGRIYLSWSASSSSPYP